MSTSDSPIRLEQSGDLLRVTVQRLSDLSLLALNDLSRALAGASDEAAETVEGLRVEGVRAALNDVSGSLYLSDIRARREAVEQPSEAHLERNELLDRLSRAVASGQTQQARPLLDLALERFRGDALVSVAAGFSHWAWGALEEARACFVRAQSPLADAGLKADALFLQAVVSAELGELELAVNLLERTAVTEQSLAEAWTRPVARARYEQARLLAHCLRTGSLSGDYTDRCRRALVSALESNGFFFGPAYVDPVFGFLANWRAELHDRFNAISLQAALIGNTGVGLVRDLQAKRLVDQNTLQRARDVFDARGFFSRSRLMAVGVRTAVKLREAAAENLAARWAAALAARDSEYTQAESIRGRGVELAEAERAHGVQTTRALDMRAFAIRQTMSDRFHVAEPLEPQHKRLADELRRARNQRLALLGVGAAVLLIGAALVPAWWGKLAAAAVVVGAAAWLVYARQRQYRESVSQLAAELERAREVKSLERNIVVTAEQSESQSRSVQSRAEGEQRLRLERAANRFAEERSDVRRCAETLAQASARFFRTIGQEALPEAAFAPLNVDREAGQPTGERLGRSDG